MKTHRDLSGDGGSDVEGQVAAQRQAVARRLRPIGSVVAIASGKGGVGKSTVTVQLARALRRRGESVAVLDADLNGPSLPHLLGLPSGGARPGEHGLVPPETEDGIAVMSTDLFLRGEDEPLRYEGPAADPFAWRGAAEATTLREFLAQTAWGERDWLLLDLPPGADRLPNLLGLLPALAGVAFVTVGSTVSLRVVRKAITVAKDNAVPLLGLVENMAGYACAECRHVGPLFGLPGAASAMAADLGLPLLASIPFDPGLADESDGAGTPSDTALGATDRLAAMIEERVRLLASQDGGPPA